MSEGSRARRRSNAADRRPLRFWEPFNVWWRAELERTGKRATAEDINRWYQAQSAHAWGADKPSLQETRTHAKCLRSVSSVRDYFREYRAKKKHEQSELEMDEEQEQGEEEDDDDQRSRSTYKRSGRRSKAAQSHSTAAYSDASGALQSYLAHSNEQGYWGSGHYEGTASGISTAAAAAAAAAATGSDGQTALAQAMAGHGQQLAALDAAGIHPGALDAAWASYQPGHAAGTAVTTPGPILPSTQAQEDQAQYQAYGGPTADTAAAAANATLVWQQPAPMAGAPGSTDEQQSQQQQVQQQEHHNLGVSLPHLGNTAAAHMSLNSLLSPQLQQLAASFTYQTEYPAMSPRIQSHRAQAQAVEANMTASNILSTQGLPAVRDQVSTYLGSQGAAATAAAALSPAQTRDKPHATGNTAQVKQEPNAGHHQPHPGQIGTRLWNQAQQDYSIMGQYAALAGQGYFAGAGAAFGGYSAAPEAQANAVHGLQRRSSSEDPMQAAAGYCGDSAALHSCGLRGMPAAFAASGDPCAGGDAASAVPMQPCQLLVSAVNAHQGGNQPSSRPEACTTGATATAPEAVTAPAATPACDGPGSSPRGVIPASLLAAMPLSATLPGCPGHSNVDSILQQLEVGRSPRGLSAAGMRTGVQGPGQQRTQSYQRMSISALLDAPGGPPLDAAAARRLSQSLEHLSLPQQRMSLWAMGSGMLDMLAEGMDLDTFLGTGDTVHPPAAGAENTIAPVAPGSRVSFRWMRSSCQLQLPDHWQHHIQTLQDAPFSRAAAPPTTGLQDPGQPHRPCLHLDRSSSAGIDALAEAAAAALAARPDLLAGHAAPAAATPQALPADQAATAAGTEGHCGTIRDAINQEVAEEAALMVLGTLERKRVRHEPAPGNEGLRCQPDMGPPARGVKRPCGAPQPGLGVALITESLTQGAGQQAGNTDSRANPQAFKFVLDLATPRPLQPAQQEQQQQQQALEAPQTAPQLQQQPSNAAHRRTLVLDLRPEDVGATSENSLRTPLHDAAQQHPQAQLLLGQGQAEPPQQPPKALKRADGCSQPLQLPSILSPAFADTGLAGVSTMQGMLQCGPATAASTTGAAPTVGPDGAPLPAPAMAHVARAAAMVATAGAAMRPPVMPGQQHGHAGPAGAGLVRAADPAKRLLPAMHEIEGMI